MQITAAEKGFVPHGSMQELFKELKMDEESIIETVKNL